MSFSQYGLCRDVSLSAFDFLFSEIVEYTRFNHKVKRVNNQNHNQLNHSSNNSKNVASNVSGTAGKDANAAAPVTSSGAAELEGQSDASALEGANDTTTEAAATEAAATTTTDPISTQISTLNEFVTKDIKTNWITIVESTSPSTVDEIESKLSGIGEKVGIRLSELIRMRMGINGGVPIARNSVFQTKRDKRDTRVINVLSFIHTHVWRYAFGHQATVLERGVDDENEYMITDNEPTIGKLIGVSTRDMGQLSLGAFAAGIIKSILDGYQFKCKSVTAHQTGDKDFPQRLTLLIKFDNDVIERETSLT